MDVFYWYPVLAWTLAIAIITGCFFCCCCCCCCKSSKKGQNQLQQQQMMYPVIVSQTGQNIQQGINNSTAPQPTVYYISADQLRNLSTTPGGGGNISNVMLPVNPNYSGQPRPDASRNSFRTTPSNAPAAQVTSADLPPTYQEAVGSNIPRY